MLPWQPFSPAGGLPALKDGEDVKGGAVSSDLVRRGHESLFDASFSNAAATSENCFSSAISPRERMTSAEDGPLSNAHGAYV